MLACPTFFIDNLNGYEEKRFANYERIDFRIAVGLRECEARSNPYIA